MAYSHNALCVSPAMTSNTAPSPAVTSASSELNASYAAWIAFRQAASIGWVANAGLPAWLKIDLGAGNEATIGSYTITSRNDGYPENAPRDWTVEGSNNDSSWTTLDTVTGEVSWGTEEMRTFTCDSVSGPYRYFRITITNDNGGSQPVIGQIEYLEGEPGPEITGKVTLPLSVIDGTIDNPYRYITSGMGPLPMLAVGTGVGGGVLDNPSRTIYRFQPLPMMSLVGAMDAPPIIAGSFSLPLLAISGGIVRYEQIAGYGDPLLSLPAIEGFGTGGAFGELTIPSITISSSMVTSLIGSLSQQLGRVTLDASMSSQNKGALLSTLGAVQISASGHQGLMGTLDLPIPAIRLTANSTMSSVGNLAASLKAITIVSSGHMVLTNSAALTIPSIRLEARASSGSAQILCINTKNYGLTKYTSFAYNSLCRFNGLHIAAKPGGIYELSGTEDAGENIEWKLRTGKIPMHNQRLREIWLFGKISANVLMTVETAEGDRYDYNVPVSSENEDRSRIKVGKGIRSEYIVIEFTDAEGESIAFDMIEGRGQKL